MALIVQALGCRKGLNMITLKLANFQKKPSDTQPKSDIEDPDLEKRITKIVQEQRKKHEDEEQHNPALLDNVIDRLSDKLILGNSASALHLLQERDEEMGMKLDSISAKLEAAKDIVNFYKKESEQEEKNQLHRLQLISVVAAACAGVIFLRYK